MFKKTKFKISLDLDKETCEKIETIAMIKFTDKSKIIREAIRHYLKKHEKILKEESERN